MFTPQQTHKHTQTHKQIRTSTHVHEQIRDQSLLLKYFAKADGDLWKRWTAAATHVPASAAQCLVQMTTVSSKPARWKLSAESAELVRQYMAEWGEEDQEQPAA
jgi:hypothetical protein